MEQRSVGGGNASSTQHSYERVVTKKPRILAELSRPSDWPATVSQLASKLCATNNHLPPRGPTLLPGTPVHLARFPSLPLSSLPSRTSLLLSLPPSRYPDNQSRSSYFRAIQPSPPVLPGLRLGSRCLIPRERRRFSMEFVSERAFCEPTSVTTTRSPVCLRPLTRFVR